MEGPEQLALAEYLPVNLARDAQGGFGGQPRRIADLLGAVYLMEWAPRGLSDTGQVDFQDPTMICVAGDALPGSVWSGEHADCPA
jgi:hypothetical protein